MIRTCLYVKDHRGVLITGLACLSMALAPMPVWGQWNGTNPVWTNNNVGIGSSTPFSALHVRASGSNAWITLNNSIAGKYWYQGFLDNGNFNISYSPDLVSFPTRLTIDTSGNVGMGTTTPQYKLAVNGNIGAQDIIVTNTGWPDYVFRPGYRLRPLSEISQFIQANGHLPDIPTEAEVKEKGVSLGDMQVKLLAKVEELTLHMIQQEKENQELRERVARLEGAAANAPVTVVR